MNWYRWCFSVRPPAPRLHLLEDDILVIKRRQRQTQRQTARDLKLRVSRRDWGWDRLDGHHIESWTGSTAHHLQLDDCLLNFISSVCGIFIYHHEHPGHHDKLVVPLPPPSQSIIVDLQPRPSKAWTWPTLEPSCLYYPSHPLSSSSWHSAHPS